MKLKYIILLIVMAVSVGIIITLYADASTYVTFETASENEGSEYHVIGELVKDSTMVYDPEKDPNHLEFYMTDSLHQVKKVIYHSPKPPDLERSEKVVIVGKMKGEHFHAQKILLKCPSKYNDGTLETTEYEATES